MEKQRITIMTNGEWGSTQVWIDEKEIYCEGVQIQGNKHIDLDIALVISHSKTTEGEIDNLLHPPKRLANAIGFQCGEEEDCYEDDDE